MRDTNKDWKKRWKQIAKEDQDWDYGYLDTLVGHKLELMLEYFNSDKCVCADESRLPIVKELQEVVDLYHKIYSGQYTKEASDFFVAHCFETITNEKEKGQLVFNNKWDDEENYKVWLKMEEAACEEERQDRQLFYSLIGKYELEWWD